MHQRPSSGSLYLGEWSQQRATDLSRTGGLPLASSPSPAPACLWVAASPPGSRTQVLLAPRQAATLQGLLIPTAPRPRIWEGRG